MMHKLCISIESRNGWKQLLKQRETGDRRMGFSAVCRQFLASDLVTAHSRTSHNCQPKRRNAWGVATAQSRHQVYIVSPQKISSKVLKGLHYKELGIVGQISKHALVSLLSILVWLRSHCIWKLAWTWTKLQKSAPICGSRRKVRVKEN